MTGRGDWDVGTARFAIAPTLEAAGIEPMSEEEIDAEVKAVRAARRARRQEPPK